MERVKKKKVTIQNTNKEVDWFFIIIIIIKINLLAYDMIMEINLKNLVQRKKQNS